MKKKILTLALAALMLLGAVALTACGPAYNTVDDIKAAGKLVVYTEAGFAPYEFVYNNEIVGVDIEIMQKVADKLGVELVIEDVLFDSITGAVHSGKADVGAAGITINAERAEEVDFSIPYTQTEQYVVVLATNESVTSAESLKGKTVGVQQGTTSDFLVEDMIADGTMAGATLTPYDAPAVAAAALGKIDAVVTDKLTAQIIVNGSNGQYKTFKLVKADGSDVADEVEAYGICVGKGNETLLAVINEVLEELLAEDTITKWEVEFNTLAESAQ